MAKKAELDPGTPKSVTRRGFLKGGAAAGVGGAAALAELGATEAKAADIAEPRSGCRGRRSGCGGAARGHGGGIWARR
jgi:anaerobic selenocysteine-containing dehydrogenase